MPAAGMQLRHARTIRIRVECASYRAGVTSDETATCSSFNRAT
jgi:hypothetical protein